MLEGRLRLFMLLGEEREEGRCMEEDCNDKDWGCCLVCAEEGLMSLRGVGSGISTRSKLKDGGVGAMGAWIMGGGWRLGCCMSWTLACFLACCLRMISRTGSQQAQDESLQRR